METETKHLAYPTLTPYLIVEDAEALIGFLKQVFDAQEGYRQMCPERS